MLCRLSKDYVWKCKSAEREKTKGRASGGGVLVGIRKRSARGVRIKEWERGFVIEDVRLHRGKEVTLVVVYNNVGMNKIKNRLKELAKGYTENGKHLLIVGDLNARIGEMQCAVERREEVSRKSEDKVVNYEGKKLLKLCDEVEGRTKNGDTKGDWEGKITNVEEGNGSVLDLVIEIENGEGSEVEELVVLPKIESDHLPVFFFLGGEGVEEVNKEPGQRVTYKLQWENEKAGQYRELMGKNGRVQYFQDRTIKVNGRRLGSWA